jgi:lysophospholipase L1-like esterase
VRSRWGGAISGVVAAVLCAVCLAAPALGRTTGGNEVRAGAQPFTVTGPIVALGDSYTAGLLFPLAPTSKPLGCFRSTANYATLVAKALHASGDLTDVACEGAGVAAMSTGERTDLGTNPPQLDALGAGDSLVMLTLGGDDLGFTHVLDECMLLSVTDLFGSPCEAHYASGGTDQLARLVSGEAPKMTAVLTAIHAKAPDARVLLLGYPDLFPQTGGCWPKVPITGGDVAYLRGIELKVNAMLATAAAATGTTYVDTYDPTVGHDFCQRHSVKDIEGIIPTSLTYSFHPNAHGQSVMAGKVLAALGA